MKFLYYFREFIFFTWTEYGPKKKHNASNFKLQRTTTKERVVVTKSYFQTSNSISFIICITHIFDEKLQSIVITIDERSTIIRRNFMTKEENVLI